MNRFEWDLYLQVYHLKQKKLVDVASSVGLFESAVQLFGGKKCTSSAKYVIICFLCVFVDARLKQTGQQTFSRILR